MANERIVSPGVFTRERDLSFLTQGISEIGGAFIGPTPKGPAFIPTIVRSQQEYVTRFGEADANHYTGLTVKNYLRESGVATVVRVLGTEGYDADDVPSIVITATSANGTWTYAVLHPSIATSGSGFASASLTGTTSSFTIETADAVIGSATSSTLSINSAASNFIGDYFGYSPDALATDPDGGERPPAYIYAIFPEAITSASAGGEAVTLAADISTTHLDFAGNSFSNASTPWIQSQTVGGDNVDLFRLHTLSDGVVANTEIKVSFLNMKKPIADDDWGTFSMLIRRFDDTDTRIEVLEQYDNVTMDPRSPNYIARVIGNSAPFDDPVTNERYYQGDFPNRSSYVYVEVNENTSIPRTAVPFGFGRLYAPVSGSNDLVGPNLLKSRWDSAGTLLVDYTTTATDKRYYYGWNFLVEEGTNTSYLAPIPDNAAQIGEEFNIEDLGFQVPKSTAPFSASIDLDDNDSLPYRRFTVPFQGGFDGMNPAQPEFLGGAIVANNSQGFDLSTAVADGSVAYKKALDAIANPDQFDFNLLVLPGVIYEYHSAITDYALNICEDRGDAFYIMDTVGLNATIQTATGKANEIDSNYAATYYPWLRVIDTNTNRLIWVPPSVVLPEIYAYNDNVAAEWFAPAGLNRGGISAAVGVRVRLAQGARDTLYENKVNPIAQFPGQGICVWGQKTLQRRASALDRVNVRRLLIALKKFIASASRYLVFEQNVEATRNRFLNIVNPYLASVQERSGLYAFRVVMDETNNTPDIIDRNILYGQIYLQPTKTAEFIVLDFNVLPTGATFPTI